MTEDLRDRLSEAIYQLSPFVLQLVSALGILMVGIAVAKMVERGTDIALHRIGFDRWMREGGVTEALERAGTTLDPSTVVARLVFWAMILLVIVMAASALGIPAVNVLFGQLLSYIPSVIIAVVVLVLGILLGEFVKDLVLASAGSIPGVVALARAAKGSVILLAVFMALEQLEIAQDIVLVFFIAVVGAAALATGLAFGLGGREVAGEITRSWYDRARADARRRAEREAAYQRAAAAAHALDSRRPAPRQPPSPGTEPASSDPDPAPFAEPDSPAHEGHGPAPHGGTGEEPPRE
jgi:hypothetical protein